jgi:hypothetical protein
LDAPSLANPFAALSAIAGPAILTNACSVLALGTGNRLARVVDRTRAVVASAETDATPRAKQLEHLHIRAHMLLSALRSFYSSLGLFAATALMASLGSIAASYGSELAFQTIAIIAVLSGTLAVTTLTLGCVAIVRETRLAVKSLEEEASLSRRAAAHHA